MHRKLYQEDDYLMISGIQHFQYCRRQWALIHIEQQWAENIHTAAGDLMHRKAHDPFLTEKRKGVLVVRALPVSSAVLGLSGECDVVEFQQTDDGIKLFGHRGFYRIYPIEYKKGKPKQTDEDIMQLAAQVMCLEEMFSTNIERGSLYYGETRRREEILITDTLRERVRQITDEMHQYFERRYTPKVKTGKKCKACSLKEICLPKLEKTCSVKTYLDRAAEETG